MTTSPLVAASAAVSRSKWRWLTMRLPPGLSASNVVTADVDLVDEFVADRRLGKHVVGRDADLTRVDQLGPCDALGRDVEVGVGGDDDGALAAKFQGDRASGGLRLLS